MKTSHQCLLKNRSILIIRDIMDFFLCFLIPLILIFIQSCRTSLSLSDQSRLNLKSEKSTRKMKELAYKLTMLPFILLAFYLPIFIATWLNNLAIYGYFTLFTTIRLINTYLFLYSILFHQLCCCFVLFIHFYFDKHLRKSLTSALNEKKSSIRVNHHLLKVNQNNR